MNFFRYVINFLLSLILLFTLMIFQISFFQRTTLFNSSFYKNTLKKTNYYTYLKEELQNSFKHISLMTKVPENLFNEALSDEWLVTQTEASIDGAINYFKHKTPLSPSIIDTSSIEKNLKDDMIKYIAQSGIKTSSQVDKELDKIATDSGTLLSNHVNILNFNSLSSSSAFNKAVTIINKLYNSFYLIIGINLLLILLIVVLNKGILGLGLEWVGFSFVVSSIFMGFPPGLLYFTKKFEKLALANSYLKEALTAFLKGFSQNLMLFSLIMLLAGIIIIIFNSLLTKSKTP